MKLIKNFLIILIFTVFLNFSTYSQVKQDTAVTKVTEVKPKKNKFKSIFKKIVTAPKYAGYSLRLFTDKYGRVNF